MKPIDIVITWVDGDDPIHKKKREKYLASSNLQQYDDIAGTTRYRSVGEIDYCVASILRFAPFVNHIYIVTDNQDPQLDPFINKYFPENQIPISIIDHKTIFKGYEEYLPTFNSLSIETMLYRIPGLSENFVYLNDDFMLTAPIKPEDWFINDMPVIYGYWHYTFTARLMRTIGKLKKGHSAFKFRDSMLNAATILGKKASWKFFRIVHAPLALKRSLYERFYQEHPNLLVHNIQHRFREKTQYNPQVLFQTMMAVDHQCIVKSDKNTVAYLQPRPHRPKNFRKQMEKIYHQKGFLFCCINSLDQGTEEQQKEIVDWIKSVLHL